LLLRPLKKITDKLRGISTPATFDRTPVSTNTSDFVNLDKALTDLMIRIDESFRKEKEITVNISHELLTPVAVIRSKLENILLNRETDQETAVKIEESLKTIHRLQSLINSLLLIARIESNQYLMEEYFSISEVLNDIVEELNPVAIDKEVTLLNENVPDFHFGKANRPLIFSMFYNIINNAVRNTCSGGKVIIEGVLAKGRLKIKIRDTGTGLNETQMSELFLRFKAKKANDHNGTGIGLAITKSIADLHKIEILVTSALEKGTEFSFVFPENS
jgi:signal transduction histidine kinase